MRRHSARRGQVVRPKLDGSSIYRLAGYITMPNMKCWMKHGGRRLRRRLSCTLRERRPGARRQKPFIDSIKATTALRTRVTKSRSFIVALINVRFRG
jgi:hypothetical protein